MFYDLSTLNQPGLRHGFGYQGQCFFHFSTLAWPCRIYFSQCHCFPCSFCQSQIYLLLLLPHCPNLIHNQNPCQWAWRRQLGRGSEDNSSGLNFSPCVYQVTAAHEMSGSELYLDIIHIGKRHLQKELSSFTEIIFESFFLYQIMITFFVAHVRLWKVLYNGGRHQRTQKKVYLFTTLVS